MKRGRKKIYSGSRIERNNQASKKYRQTFKGKLKDHKSNLKRNYDLTLKDYDQMFEQQNGVCAICGNINGKGYRLAVDHNHKTGKIRSLLCSECNLILGKAKDDIGRLVKAILYLEKHN